MNKLTRYIIREMLPPFFVWTAFFTMILLMNKVVLLLETAVERDIAIKHVMMLFPNMLPFTLALTIPMGVVMAVLVAYGRFSSESEYIALMASGMKPLKIFLPAILFGLVVSVLMVGFNDTFLPHGNYNYRSSYPEIFKNKPLAMIEPNQETRLGDYNFFVSAINHHTGEMEHITIMRDVSINGKRYYERTYAERGFMLTNYESEIGPGEYSIGMQFLLSNSTTYSPDADDPDHDHIIQKKMMIMRFEEEYSVDLIRTKTPREMTACALWASIKERSGVRSNVLFQIQQKKAALASYRKQRRSEYTKKKERLDEQMRQAATADTNHLRESESLMMPFSNQRDVIAMLQEQQKKIPDEQKEKIKSLKKQLHDTKKGDPTIHLRVEFHKRFSIPFASLAMILMGLPFSIVSPRGGKGLALAFSIIIMIVWYMAYIIGEAQAQDARLMPIVGMWVGNILCALIGVIGIVLVERK